MELSLKNWNFDLQALTSLPKEILLKDASQGHVESDWENLGHTHLPHLDCAVSYEQIITTFLFDSNPFWFFSTQVDKTVLSSTPCACLPLSPSTLAISTQMEISPYFG
jgi:hypothetical protein